MFHIQSLIAVALVAVASVNAESHTIHFINNCGRGTPTLVQSGRILSTGGDFTSNGPFEAAIAYLQTGSCGLNGEGCTLVETTLKNPTSPGAGSSSDISLIPPHTFSVASGFSYFNGCDGLGEDCTNANCPGAFRTPTDGQVVSCESNNVNLNIKFCD